MNKTTADFTRIQEMGYPKGCADWTHAETYGNHRIWRRRTNRRIALMMVALIVPAVAVIAAQLAGWV